MTSVIRSTPLRTLAGAVLPAASALPPVPLMPPTHRSSLPSTDGQVARSYANLSAVGLGSTYALLASGRTDSSAMTATTTDIIRFARSKGLPVYPTVSDYSNSYAGFDPAVSDAVLASAASRAKAVANLVDLRPATISTASISTWKPCSRRSS